MFQQRTIVTPQDEALLELAATLVQQNDDEQMLKIVSRHAASTLQAETTLILLVNPQTRQTVKTVIREGQVETNRKYRNLQNQLSGWVLQNKQSLLAENLRTDARFKNLLLDDLRVHSVAGVPLRIENILFGVLLLLNESSRRTFDLAAVKHLEKLAIIAAPYLRNAQKIRNYFESPLPEAALLAKYADLGLLGKSKAFVDILKAVESAARCDVRVVLEGRSGTGKGLIANAIHRCSARRGQPFVAIDCGALPEQLVESELFGHVKGAFTGATKDRPGLFVEAHGGTLFLDEIANISLDTQAKLLRALQDREVRPIGSNKIQKIDVRLIAASSSSLRQMVERGKFREDLFYRLNVFPIRLPALDERKEDIPVLAGAFLKKFSDEHKKTAKNFHEELIDFMKLRPWSGNIRELENFVERLVVVVSDKVEIIAPAHLPKELKDEMKALDFDNAYATAGLPERVEAFEKNLVAQALHKHGGNQAQAARELKISPQALRYKIERLKIQA